MSDPLAEERRRILAHIEREEESLEEALDELTCAVRRRLHPGEQLARHPLAWLAGGFALGLYLGRRHRPE